MSDVPIPASAMATLRVLAEHGDSMAHTWTALRSHYRGATSSRIHWTNLEMDVLTAPVCEAQAASSVGHFKTLFTESVVRCRDVAEILSANPRTLLGRLRPGVGLTAANTYAPTYLLRLAEPCRNAPLSYDAPLGVEVVRQAFFTEAGPCPPEYRGPAASASPTNVRKSLTAGGRRWRPGPLSMSAAVEDMLMALRGALDDSELAILATPMRDAIEARSREEMIALNNRAVAELRALITRDASALLATGEYDQVMEARPDLWIPLWWSARYDAVREAPLVLSGLLQNVFISNEPGGETELWVNVR